jgi:predicted RNase H-like HicB family nuclease
MPGKQPNVESRWEPIPVNHPLARLEGVTVQMEWDAESEVWVTYVPELNGISTFGETREQALESTRDMILTYLQTVEEQQLGIPLGRDEVHKIRTTLG